MRRDGLSAVAELVPECGPELSGQLGDFLGEDFNVASLVTDLKRRSLFDEARGVIQSFTNDISVRQAQRATYSRTYIKASCEADTDSLSEIADFRLFLHEGESPSDESAHIEISPNAMRALYHPVREIINTISEERLPAQKIRDRAIEIAYRGIYTNVFMQFMIKRHALDVVNDEGSVSIDSVPKIAMLYEGIFGNDKIKDPGVRLDRLAMCLGGTAMLRHVARRLGETPELGVAEQQAALPLRLYAVGKLESKPADQQGVSFPLAHSLDAQTASRFLRTWFAGGPLDRPQLRLV